MKIKREYIFILIASLLICVAIPFTGYPSLDEAQKLVANKITAYTEKKYNFGKNFQQGVLKQGKSKVMTMHLYKGNKYVFITGASNETTNVRFRIFNERFEIVKDDNNGENLSCFELEALLSGAYFIKITMLKCSDDGAYWSYISGYQ